MLGERPRDRRRGAPAASVGEDEVADLDDSPLGVEVVERPAADHLPRVGIERGERQEAACLGELRELTEVGDELVTVEGGQVACLTELSVAEGGQDAIDVPRG